MEQDKAIQKVLNNSKLIGLPYGFENKVMKAIFQKAEKQVKRKFALNIVLVSLVSIAIISGTFYILHNYYSVSLNLTIPQLNYSNETKYIFAFSFYIAFIVLFLLWLDTFLRRLKKKIE